MSTAGWDTLARDTLPCVPCHRANVPANCVICHGAGYFKRGAAFGTSGRTLGQSGSPFGAHTSTSRGDISPPAVCPARNAISCPQRLPIREHYGTELDCGDKPGAISPEALLNGIALPPPAPKTYCHGNFAGGYASNAPIWDRPRSDRLRILP